MDDPQRPLDQPPPMLSSRARWLIQASDRAWRLALMLLVASVVVPFVALRAFHVLLPGALMIHMALALFGWRTMWQWWKYRLELTVERARLDPSSAPVSRARRRGSYPSAKVLLIEVTSSTWATVTASFDMEEVLGTFDDLPVHQRILAHGVHYRYEGVDTLIAPINDGQRHLVLGPLRYVEAGAQELAPPDVTTF